MMWILSRNRQRAGAEAGWRSALWLFLYATPFSWAYLRLSAGVGAFLLFGTVQATMIGAAVVHGERPPPRTWAGLALALAGLAGLTLPGAQAPPFAAAAAMIVAGLSWGAYSLPIIPSGTIAMAPATSPTQISTMSQRALTASGTVRPTARPRASK